MIVRYKPTGQIGEIPDDKFDANLFEAAQDPRKLQMPSASAGMADDPETEVRQSLAGKIGSSVMGIGKTLAEPFIRTGKNIVAATVQTPMMLIEGQLRAAGKNPTADMVEKVRKGLGPLGLTDEQFQNISDDKKGAIIQQVKDSLNVGSYAVPFGKGTNILTKAILPGAAMGAMQSTDSPEEMIGGAVLGGGTAGVLHGATQLLSKFGGKAEEIGGAMRKGTRQIREPASVYGAQKEKAISDALDTLGITGSPQKQYELLHPKMAQLGDEIQGILDANPKMLSIEKEIKPDFLANLKSSLRTKELTTSQAKKEIDGYLSDLYDLSGNKLSDTIDTPSLFKMKVDINSDFQAVQRKIDKGIALTPREKVIAAARQTVDDIIAQAHPDVKERTLLQSALYDAAPSIERSRFNPPTLRVAGTSIPGRVTQMAAEGTGKTLQGAGGAMQKLGDVLPPITQNPAVQKGVIALESASLQPPTEEPTGINGESQDTTGQQYASGNFNHTNSISDLPPITGYSSSELADAYTKAIMAGDNGAATQLKKLYDLQVAADKRTQPTKVSAGVAKDKALARSGMRGVEEVTQMLQSDPSILAKSFLTPGNLLTRKYENAAFRAAEAILRMRTGAVANPKEVKNYAQKFLPWFGDDQAAIDYKLQQALMDYNDLLMIYNAQDTSTGSQDIGLPEIQ